MPEDEYCLKFDYRVKNWRKKICKHFDLTSGCVTCDFKFDKQERTEEGFLKAPNCMELEAIK